MKKKRTPATAIAAGLMAAWFLLLPAAAAGETAGGPTGTPDPDGARGYERAPGKTGERAALLAPRLALLPARIGVQAATLPVRVLAGALSGSALPERMAHGLRTGRYFVPVVGLDPSLGASVGFRAAHGNPLSRSGIVTWRAAWGGTREQVYALTFRPRAERRPGWSYRLTAKWEVIPDHNYFGIGNATAYTSRTYYTEEKYLFLADLGHAPCPWMRFDLTLSHHRSLISHAAYIEAGERSIEHRFPSERQAPGYRLDPQNYWAELALTLDRRDHPGRTTRGWLAEIYGGHAHAAGMDATSYNRYGGELSAYLPIAGRYVVAVRAAGEEARSGDPEPMKITELIPLGGRSTLRGYVEERFLDQAAAMATLELRYRVSPFAEATLFADFGKVMPRLLDVDFTDIHRSFGGGLRIATTDLFLFRVQFARSDETYVVLGTLEPVFEREDRRDRR